MDSKGVGMSVAVSDGEVVYRVKHNGKECLVTQKDKDYYHVLIGDLFKELRQDSEVIKISDTSLLPPVRPSKVVGIGTNFLEESVDAVKTIPTTFVMPPSAIVASGSDVSIKPYFNSVLAEGELGVVIRKTAKQVDKNHVNEFILGYTIVNDLSGRDSSLETVSNFVKKSCDGFVPMGPGILLSSNIEHFNIQTVVNGEVRQQGSTKNLIYSIAECIEFITSFSTLEPGDVISMGTPLPKPSLVSGDIVNVSIERIGQLTSTIY